MCDKYIYIYMICLGTSLSGMNCDQCVERTAERLRRQNWSPSAKQYGSVIVGLQRTQHDDTASLRIFSKLDEFSRVLIEQLSLQSYLPPQGYLYALPADLPVQRVLGNDIYLVPYGNSLSLSLSLSLSISLSL